MMALEMVGELVASLGNFTQRYEKTDSKLEISNSTFHECKTCFEKHSGRDATLHPPTGPL
jgi:hypothetical protein